MNKYIKCEDAVELVYKAKRAMPIQGVLTDTMSWAIASVNEIPSADVVERKRGRWEMEWWQEGHKVRKCSYCKRSQTVNIFNGEVMFNFCPYCGADMRGISND